MLYNLGILEAVKNILSHSSPTSIALYWEPPYSLNLPTDPDIAYCVDIYRMTDGRRDEHVLSECNVLMNEFRYSCLTPDPIDRFQFIVIPRSNVQGATNGTPNQPVITSFLGIYIIVYR